ncbi:MAG: AI-2E family transporter [Thermoanaerobaculia bacterium]
MPDRKETELRIPFTTLLKIAAFVLLVVITMKLWPVIIMVFVSVLLAVVLDPLVRWLSRHHVRRGFAITVVSLTLFGLVLLFAFGLIPAMAGEVTDLWKQLPQIATRIGTAFPPLAPVLKTWIAKLQKAPNAGQIEAFLMRGMTAGMYAIEGITTVILVIVLSIYFLIEGERAIEWLISFAPRDQRHRWRELMTDTNGVLVAYMRGQAITCVLCGTIAYATLMILGIPGALPLAILAFIADLVPVVGTIAMTIPAFFLALIVSPLKAMIVLVVYTGYHFVESYVIIPRVYGGQMSLSTLTVLLAVTVGGVLQGAIGAILILPVVAIYPLVEKIFLREKLPEDTVERHEAIEES